MIKRERMEQDGLFISNPDHWELLELKIHSYSKLRKQKWKCKNGEIREYNIIQNEFSLCIPMDIVRHLNLKNGEVVSVAIRRKL